MVVTRLYNFVHQLAWYICFRWIFSLLFAFFCSTIFFSKNAANTLDTNKVDWDCDKATSYQSTASRLISTLSVSIVVHHCLLTKMCERMKKRIYTTSIFFSRVPRNKTVVRIAHDLGFVHCGTHNANEIPLSFFSHIVEHSWTRQMEREKLVHWRLGCT